MTMAQVRPPVELHGCAVRRCCTALQQQRGDAELNEAAVTRHTETRHTELATYCEKAQLQQLGSLGAVHDRSDAACFQ